MTPVWYPLMSVPSGPSSSQLRWVGSTYSQQSVDNLTHICLFSENPLSAAPPQKLKHICLCA